MLKFIDDDERVTIRSRSGESPEEFIQCIRTRLVVREQQRRKDRKAARQEAE